MVPRSVGARDLGHRPGQGTTTLFLEALTGHCTFKFLFGDVKMTVNLGDRVKDTITGFTGIAVAITQHLNGCLHIGIEAASLEPEKHRPVYDVFDIQRIEVIEAGAYKPQDHGIGAAPPGGPSDGRIRRPENTYRS